MSSSTKPIRSALISVYYKNGLDELIQCLDEFGVRIYSTGGTQKFIEELGVRVVPVEQLTEYPSILGGRVKTLHPHVFGGILARRGEHDDMQTLERYGIPEMDLVVVDLYPFEETVNNGGKEADIIEKIDIGGVSLIRAAAKNFNDVMVCCDKNDYNALVEVLKKQNAGTTLEQRKQHAAKAFATTNRYDGLIADYFNAGSSHQPVPGSTNDSQTTPLRYGENPHQKGFFRGDLTKAFSQLHGKELSYNNLLDCDAALQLIQEFSEPTVAIIKHNNACGLATDNNLLDAWKKALAGDPVSAFGGVVVSNRNINATTAAAIDEIFIEVMMAPGYDAQALEILKKKKNRIILSTNTSTNSLTQTQTQVRSALGGMLEQDLDQAISTKASLKNVTNRKATEAELDELIFAEKLCKHLKSNAIALTRNKQLLGMGCGQTSRVDALKGAIAKAKAFGFDLKGSSMASDAFFPFPDCVEIAQAEGIVSIIQPGGSIKDQDSIDAANRYDIAMVFSGLRHFRH